eukprot:SAG31_NODE_4136_length_3549_cov_13.673333_1_plen_53_part_10
MGQCSVALGQPCVPTLSGPSRLIAIAARAPATVPLTVRRVTDRGAGRRGVDRG